MPFKGLFVKPTHKADTGRWKGCELKANQATVKHVKSEMGRKFGAMPAPQWTGKSKALAISKPGKREEGWRMTEIVKAEGCHQHQMQESVEKAAVLSEEGVPLQTSLAYETATESETEYRLTEAAMKLETGPLEGYCGPDSQVEGLKALATSGFPIPQLGELEMDHQNQDLHGMKSRRVPGSKCQQLQSALQAQTEGKEVLQTGRSDQSSPRANLRCKKHTMLRTVSGHTLSHGCMSETVQGMPLKNNVKPMVQHDKTRIKTVGQSEKGKTLQSEQKYDGKYVGMAAKTNSGTLCFVQKAMGKEKALLETELAPIQTDHASRFPSEAESQISECSASDSEIRCGMQQGTAQYDHSNSESEHASKVDPNTSLQAKQKSGMDRYKRAKKRADSDHCLCCPLHPNNYNTMLFTDYMYLLRKHKFYVGRFDAAPSSSLSLQQNLDKGVCSEDGCTRVLGCDSMGVIKKTSLDLSAWPDRAKSSPSAVSDKTGPNVKVKSRTLSLKSSLDNFLKRKKGRRSSDCTTSATDERLSQKADPNASLDNLAQFIDPPTQVGRDEEEYGLGNCQSPCGHFASIHFRRAAEKMLTSEDRNLVECEECNELVDDTTLGLQSIESVDGSDSTSAESVGLGLLENSAGQIESVETLRLKSPSLKPKSMKPQHVDAASQCTKYKRHGKCRKQEALAGVYTKKVSQQVFAELQKSGDGIYLGNGLYATKLKALRPASRTAKKEKRSGNRAMTRSMESVSPTLAPDKMDIEYTEQSKSQDEFAYSIPGEQIHLCTESQQNDIEGVEMEKGELDSQNEKEKLDSCQQVVSNKPKSRLQKLSNFILNRKNSSCTTLQKANFAATDETSITENEDKSRSNVYPKCNPGIMEKKNNLEPRRGVHSISRDEESSTCQGAVKKMSATVVEADSCHFSERKDKHEISACVDERNDCVVSDRQTEAGRLAASYTNVTQVRDVQRGPHWQAEEALHVRPGAPDARGEQDLYSTHLQDDPVLSNKSVQNEDCLAMRLMNKRSYLEKHQEDSPAIKERENRTLAKGCSALRQKENNISAKDSPALRARQKENKTSPKDSPAVGARKKEKMALTKDSPGQRQKKKIAMDSPSLKLKEKIALTMDSPEVRQRETRAVDTEKPALREEENRSLEMDSSASRQKNTWSGQILQQSEFSAQGMEKCDSNDSLRKRDKLTKNERPEKGHSETDHTVRLYGVYQVCELPTSRAQSRQYEVLEAQKSSSANLPMLVPSKNEIGSYTYQIQETKVDWPTQQRMELPSESASLHSLPSLSKSPSPMQNTKSRIPVLIRRQSQDIEQSDFESELLHKNNGMAISLPAAQLISLTPVTKLQSISPSKSYSHSDISLISDTYSCPRPLSDCYQSKLHPMPFESQVQFRRKSFSPTFSSLVPESNSVKPVKNNLNRDLNSFKMSTSVQYPEKWGFTWKASKSPSPPPCNISRLPSSSTSRSPSLTVTSSSPSPLSSCLSKSPSPKSFIPVPNSPPCSKIGLRPTGPKVRKSLHNASLRNSPIDDKHAAEVPKRASSGSGSTREGVRFSSIAEESGKHVNTGLKGQRQDVSSMSRPIANNVKSKGDVKNTSTSNSAGQRRRRQTGASGKTAKRNSGRMAGRRPNVHHNLLLYDCFK